MGYRPITDIWILARCRYKSGVKRYGGYLGGFACRARALLGVRLNEPVLHVCGGLAKEYPYKRGYGPNDQTLDLDPDIEPDFIQDARDPFPQFLTTEAAARVDSADYEGHADTRFKAYLIDPPYSEVDAEKYKPGRDKYPKPNLLVQNAIDALPVGGRVGIIHYMWPGLPKKAIEVAVIGVTCGRNNRMRQYTVLEKMEE